MKKIVFIGECMIEEHDDGQFRYGGDTLNTALYLARTNKDINVCYATAVGIDHDSGLLLSQWKKEGINTSYCIGLVDKSPGRYKIQTNSLGERKFSYQRERSAARHYVEEMPTRLQNDLLEERIDYCYLSGISLAILSKPQRQKIYQLLAAFRGNGGKVIFDNNYRPQLWKKSEALVEYDSIMRLTDIAFLTDEDEYQLYPDLQSVAAIIDRTRVFGVKEVIVKQGNNPCTIVTEHNVKHVDAEQLDKSNIVDTCAAGDAFAAGYLAKRLSGQPIIESATFAHQLAARVIQYSGAIIPQRAMSDLMA